MQYFDFKNLLKSTKVLPLTVQILRTGLIKVTIAGEKTPIIAVTDANLLLPIKFVGFSTWGDTSAKWWYNCEGDDKGDKLEPFKQNLTDYWPTEDEECESNPPEIIGLHDYITMIELKEIELKGLPKAIALLQKLQILVESCRDLDSSFSLLLSNTPNDQLELAVKVLSSVKDDKPENANLLKAITESEDALKKMKSEFYGVIIDYENKKFHKLQYIFTLIKEWNGIINAKNQLNWFNEALTSAIDRMTTIIETIKIYNAYHQKRLIISFDIIATAKKLETIGESTDLVSNKEEFLAQIKTKMDEIENLKPKDDSSQQFPESIVSDINSLKTYLDVMATAVGNAIDVTVAADKEVTSTTDSSNDS